jgi:hypothetical protein
MKKKRTTRKSKKHTTTDPLLIAAAEFVNAHGGAGSVLEFIGAEVTWEMLKTDNGWFVRASHHGATDDDTFKFEASHKRLDNAVALVGRKVWKHGPRWIRG